MHLYASAFLKRMATNSIIFKLKLIDLSDVEFCDSTGLSALLIAERQMRENSGRVKLVGVHKKVLSLLKISHLDRTFQIFDTLAKAVKG
jgi:anti-sigma B factor antagonist